MVFTVVVDNGIGNMASSLIVPKIDVPRLLPISHRRQKNANSLLGVSYCFLKALPLF
jgi:hypothetical protein